ncbi:MAG: hypothetical protein GX590_02975 [Lentisphaerae bacterium]|jgi:hypothetical protein|nr:hypothetical protein [Lentisphaerota bacterium]
MKVAIFFAYLDPGTGSIIIQAVVGGVLGGMLVIKLFWKKIVSFFKGGNAKSEAPSDQTRPPAQ